MAGGPAYLLLGAVAHVGPRSPSKTHLNSLSLISKTTCKFSIRLQNSNENPKFPLITQPHVWIRHPATKILRRPPLQVVVCGTNSGSSPEEKTSSEAAVAYVVEKLGDLLFEKAPLGGVYVDLKWIQRELDEIQFFLKDADSKQNTDERVRKWVAEIRDVSYEVEDVIDIFIYNQRRRHGFLGPVNRFFSERMARSDVAKQIEQIKLKISEISIRKETYGIIRDVNEGRHEASSARKGLEDRWRFSTSLEEMK